MEMADLATYVADVKKYAANADEAAIAGLVKYLGIALHNRDSSLVSGSDAKELARVRDNFLKKKLGLTESDEKLDAAVKAVIETMKADRTKSRVTVYYLLADKYGRLAQLRSPATRAAAAPVQKKVAAMAASAPKGPSKSMADPKAKASKAKAPAASKAVTKPAAAATSASKTSASKAGAKSATKAKAPAKAAKPAAAKAPAKSAAAKPAKAAKPAAKSTAKAASKPASASKTTKKK
jgi:hypothetical protein